MGKLHSPPFCRNSSLERPLRGTDGHEHTTDASSPPVAGDGHFPGLTAPIAAGRPGTLRAIESALKGDRLVFAVAQRDNTDEPKRRNPLSHGRHRPHRPGSARTGRRAAAAPGRAARHGAPVHAGRRLPLRRRDGHRGDVAARREGPRVRGAAQGNPRARRRARRTPRPSRGSRAPGARFRHGARQVRRPRRRLHRADGAGEAGTPRDALRRGAPAPRARARAAPDRRCSRRRRRSSRRCRRSSASASARCSCASR